VDGREGLGLIQDAIDEHLIGGCVAAFCAIPFVAQPFEPGGTLTDKMDGRRLGLFQSP